MKSFHTGTVDVAGISSSKSVDSAVRAGYQQLRVQEARRAAERAEQVARGLEAQAQAAQRAADRADENARSLSVQSDQAHVDAGRARQGVVYLDSVGRMGDRLGAFVTQVAERTAAPAERVEPAVAPPAAVVNTQGQLTGTLVSTIA